MLKKYFTREVKIGFLIIISGFILFFGLNYLKGINVFNPTNYYRASFVDIGGLQETNPVFIKGHQIGQIKKINYDFSKEEAFEIILDVSSDLKIPQGTIVELFDNGMLGEKAIRLLLPANLKADYYERGALLPSAVAPGMIEGLVSEIPKVTHVLESIDSLLISVRKLTESSQLKHTLMSMEHITADLEVSAAELRSFMKKDLPQISKNINAMTADFATAGNNLSKVDFEKTVQNLDKTAESLESVTQKINNGTGTVGLLINDPTLYNNLNATSQSANTLITDLQNNPKRYVHFSIFGKKDKK